MQSSSRSQKGKGKVGVPQMLGLQILARGFHLDDKVY